MFRGFFILTLLLVPGLAFLAAQATPVPGNRIPVILDTDIGDDIDDSWALVLLLKSARLDIKLVTTTYFKADYRGKLIAKYFTTAGRTDIPIGLGAEGHNEGPERMTPWIANFKWENYRGKVLKDGPQAIVDTINRSTVPVTVIAIGPLNTLGAALRVDPGIAAKADLVGMQGSINRDYQGLPRPIGEYNVHRDIPDAQAVFSAPWRSMVITPLDTCGNVRLSGERLAKLKASPDKLLEALLESHRIHNQITDPEKLVISGTCFDDVAVYMADPANRNFLNYKKMPITVDDRGFTLVAPTGKPMDVAITWRDKKGFLDYMAKTLLTPTP